MNVKWSSRPVWFAAALINLLLLLDFADQDSGVFDALGDFANSNFLKSEDIHKSRIFLWSIIDSSTFFTWLFYSEDPEDNIFFCPYIIKRLHGGIKYQIMNPGLNLLLWMNRSQAIVLHIHMHFFHTKINQDNIS